MVSVVQIGSSTVGGFVVVGVGSGYVTVPPGTTMTPVGANPPCGWGAAAGFGAARATDASERIDKNENLIMLKDG